jgi:hypothetical protein
MTHDKRKIDIFNLYHYTYRMVLRSDTKRSFRHCQGVLLLLDCHFIRRRMWFGLSRLYVCIGFHHLCTDIMVIVALSNANEELACFVLFYFYLPCSRSLSTCLALFSSDRYSSKTQLMNRSASGTAYGSAVTVKPILPA